MAEPLYFLCGATIADPSVGELSDILSQTGKELHVPLEPTVLSLEADLSTRFACALSHLASHCWGTRAADLSTLV